MERIAEIVSSAPWYKLVGMKARVDGEGIVVELSLDRERHFQALGLVHGGVIASVLDSAIGLNVNGELAKLNKTAVTAQLNIHYVRPVRGGKIVGRGKVLHIGSRTAVGYGEIRNEKGELVATGTATFYII